jgi:hypothetical protein
MSVFSFALALFNALAAIPKILEYLNSFAAGVVQWYVERQTNETLREIADAAALASRAKTSEERYAALGKWRAALSRPRVGA